MSAVTRASIGARREALRLPFDRALAVDLLLLLFVGLAAVAVRAIGITNQTDISDEGIRGLQLRLMAAGYWPVSEIYSSQGPLALWIFYPLEALFGPDIVVARVTVVTFSLVALGGIYYLGREMAGRVAGVAAALVLAVSPVFVENSRLAFVEVPSIALTVVGMAGLVRFRATGSRGWLVAAAILAALGVLAKPMAAVVYPAALAPLVFRPRTDATPWAYGRAVLVDQVVFGAVTLAVSVGVVLAVGAGAIYDQVVTYRVAAREVRGWDLAANLQLLGHELSRHGLGLLALALIGGVVALVRRNLIGGMAVVWLVGAVGGLLAYSPLWPKHVAYVVPPLALLVGAAVAEAGRLLARLPAGRGAGLPLAFGAGVAALAVISFPAISADDRAQIAGRPSGTARTRFADDLRIVEAATRPDDFIVMDDAYPAMLTGRLTPPPLADLSWNRLLARALTAEQAIAATRQYGTRVLVIQDDHLGLLPRYVAWADREYRLVRSYVQRRPDKYRRVYVSADVDRATLLPILRASLDTPTDATIGPADLLGYELERRDFKVGSRVALDFLWRARQDAPPALSLITRLRNDAGRVASEGRWNVGDGAQVLNTWSAGDWQSQRVRWLISDVPPGSYHLTVALVDGRGRGQPVTATSGATASASGDELDLGAVTVRTGGGPASPADDADPDDAPTPR